jgi:Glyoxalase-like domain
VSLRIEDLVIDCAEPLPLARFWADALGLEITQSSEEEGDVWVVIGDPGQRGLSLFFQQVPEQKAAKNRLHLDVRPARTRDEEVERLRGLGATVLQGFGGPEATWTVMQDPEGNEFCVLRGPDDPLPPGGSPVEA